MALICDRVSLAKAGRLEDTPQGYLWCRDVPLARTGTMDYAPFEVPEIPPAPGQRIITVERTADEVFHPDAIASFRGMPLTDDHPVEFVTAETNREHRIGDIHDPRRGEGEHADCLVADLLVTDPAAIALIKSRRKRELSCGYDAAYADIRPGYGRQINIRGNHVSLVDAGRAGPRIAIMDRLMSKSTPRRRSGMLDALFAAFKSDDPTVAANQRRALDEAMTGDPDDNGDAPMVVVHAHAPPPDKGPDEPKPKPGDNPDPERGRTMDEDQIKALVNTAVEEALAASAEASAAATKAAVEEATGPLQTKIDELTGTLQDMSDPQDIGMQDAVARAAILAPGLTLPSRDAKPGSQAHLDAMSTFKREALKRAVGTDVGRAAVEMIVPGRAQAHSIAAMSPAEVSAAFNGASALIASHNTTDAAATLISATSGYVRDDAGKRVRPMTTADLAKLHKDHYAPRRA